MPLLAAILVDCADALGQFCSLMTSAALHLCSTVRNVYAAAGIASGRPELAHHLRVIDQADAGGNQFLQAVKAHPGPFASIEFLTKGRGHSGKKQARQQAFEHLAADAERLRPELVLTGNDRRLESQYLCMFMRRGGQQFSSVFVDEGIGTYVHGQYQRSRGRALANAIFDPIGKKLRYGLWYQGSRHLGATRWIDECWAMFPALCPAQLNKPVRELDRQAFLGADFQAYLLSISEAMGIEAIPKADALLLLPHSQILSTQGETSEGICAAISYLQQQGLSVQIKYHPSEKRRYVEQVGGVTEIPNRIPMEVLMGTCNPTVVAGGLSSALLSYRWLKPEATVACIGPTSNDVENPYHRILKGAGIQTADSYAQLSELLESPA